MSSLPWFPNSRNSWRRRNRPPPRPDPWSSSLVWRPDKGSKPEDTTETPKFGNKNKQLTGICCLLHKKRRNTRVCVFKLKAINKNKFQNLVAKIWPSNLRSHQEGFMKKQKRVRWWIFHFFSWVMWSNGFTRETRLRCVDYKWRIPRHGMKSKQTGGLVQIYQRRIQVTWING